MIKATQKSNKGEKKKAEDKVMVAEEDANLVSPLALLLNNLERLKGLVDLCQPSDANRQLYMNAWSYCYLKNCVLTITNPNDYGICQP